MRCYDHCRNFLGITVPTRRTKARVLPRLDLAPDLCGRAGCGLQVLSEKIDQDLKADTVSVLVLCEDNGRGMEPDGDLLAPRSPLRGYAGC